MTETTLPIEAKSPAAHTGWIDRGARRLLFAGLKGLPQGCLSWSDTEQTQTFGQGAATPDLAPVAVTVHDPRFYRRPLVGGSLGVADGYIRGEWECELGDRSGPSELTRLFRLFLRSQETADRFESGFARVKGVAARVRHALRSNSKRGSRRNIHEHYDLGNDFFQLFLDPTLAYSCGVFESPDATLEEASIAKFDRLIAALDLRSTDHLLEIGTGWGGFAIHAAEQTGCRITTTTISQEQFKFALAKVEERGLTGQIDVRLEDYRDLSGQFTKAVAIEMIEAVGDPYLPTFFNTIRDRLTPGGLFAVQAITMPEHRYRRYLKSVDFIRAFVFPGSCCPSITAMTSAASEKSDFRLVHCDDIGLHYATTLKRWRERFWSNIEEVRALGYSEQFIRLWHYYLCYCEAGFAERYTSNVHLVFERSNTATPITRRIRNSMGKRTT